MSPRVIQFDWDEANTAHIARHDVVPSEVREAFLDGGASGERYSFRNGELRYVMLGRTKADRLLRIVYIIRRGAVRPVTAYTASRNDERSYEARRRQDGTQYSRFRF